MVEMMEMLRTLVWEKGQATDLGQQSDAAHPDQRREESAYPPGFTAPYAQMLPISQMRGLPMAMRLL